MKLLSVATVLAGSQLRHGRPALVQVQLPRVEQVEPGEHEQHRSSRACSVLRRFDCPRPRELSDDNWKVTASESRFGWDGRGDPLPWNRKTGGRVGASSFLLLQLICVCDNLSVPNANGASKDRYVDELEFVITKKTVVQSHK